MHRPDDLIDLHVHSTASDGIFSPHELVARGVANGVSTLSITDHDTLDGIAGGIASAGEYGIEFVPGVELSVNLGRDELTAHLLGYFPGVPLDVLTDRETALGRGISFVQNGRTARNPRILSKLSEVGVEIDMESVKRIAGGEVVGRPHIAEALVQAGYIDEAKDAFTLYLARGKPAYVERDRLKVDEAISCIHGSGGIPVLAHPGFIPADTASLAALLEHLTDIGLMGVEVYYPGHDRSMREFLKGTSDRLGLVVTGGTDFHGWKPNPMGPGRAQGGFQVTRSMVEAFLTLCGGRIETEGTNGEAQ